MLLNRAIKYVQGLRINILASITKVKKLAAMYYWKLKLPEMKSGYINKDFLEKEE